MQPGLHAVADGRHGLALGEDLRIRADADLQVLRPRALLDQHALQFGRLRAARHQRADVAAELGLHASADRLGLRGRAARLLLDDALQHRQREGDAGGLDRLQVAGREQPRLLGIAIGFRGVGEDGIERADALALAVADDGRRIVRLAQVAHGRRQARDVVDAVGAHRHHRRPARIGQPDAACQRTAGAVLRQRACGCHVIGYAGHAFPLLNYRAEKFSFGRRAIACDNGRDFANVSHKTGLEDTHPVCRAGSFQEDR